ncbi:MAG: hypothetical protein Q8L69_07825, partial [Gallionellaceae bacterium]|nr:hypothetical protein [Gallionellaceae bacterium]
MHPYSRKDGILPKRTTQGQLLLPPLLISGTIPAPLFITIFLSAKGGGMSEIAKLKQFNPVSAQPPLRWYFDPKVLE